MDAKINQRTQVLATKDDLKEAILTTKYELKQEISALRESTKDDMRKLREDLTRTIYTTSMGQLFAIVVSVISLILLILKK